MWTRVIGGTVETQATGVSTIDTTQVGVVTSGSQKCNTTTRQDFKGVQFGRDISILNEGGSGANWHFGATAGYFEAEAKDVTPGGTFNGNFQVPFAGLYTVFTHGNFFADGLARADFYQSNVSDIANGLLGQNFNAKGFALTGNLGYRLDIGATG